MSRVRVHNFSISLDGFATGEGQSLETPFGHAGQRLHQWMFATRYAREELFGQSGGSEGADDAIAQRHVHVVDEPGSDEVADHGRTAADPHVLAARGLAGRLERLGR